VISQAARAVIGFPASIGYSPRYFLEQLNGDEPAKSLILLVPGERIELPTNGLQNRCSTAELTRRTYRHFKGLGLYAACAETPLATILLPTGLLPMK
jgi:hypothetical protein